MRAFKKIALILAAAALPLATVADTTTTIRTDVLKGKPTLTISNGGGTLSLPSSTDTLVGRATTDTLTNKSMSGGSNTFTNIPNSATTAASANTASAIVARDGSGNFSAGTITANLTGNVTGNVTGAVTGNALTATALAANPSDCAAGTKATAIDAGGNLTCSSVDLSADTAATALPIAKGGTGLTAAGTGNYILGANNAGNALEYKQLVEGSNITITHGAGTVTITSNAGVANSATEAKSAIYTLTGSDDLITTDASGGNFTLSLPAAASNDGKIFRFSNTGASGVVTIDPNGAETIGGIATWKLATTDDYLSIISNGSNWLIVVDGTYIGAKYSTDAGQSIDATTAEVVNFEDVEYDPWSAVTTGASWKFTAPVAGKYEVCAAAQYNGASWTAGSLTRIDVYKNGAVSNRIGYYTITVTNSWNIGVAGCTTVALSATDYIDARLYNPEGTGRALTSGAGSGIANWVTVRRVK